MYILFNFKPYQYSPNKRSRMLNCSVTSSFLTFTSTGYFGSFFLRILSYVSCHIQASVPIDNLLSFLRLWDWNHQSISSSVKFKGVSHNSSLWVLEYICEPWDSQNIFIGTSRRGSWMEISVNPYWFWNKIWSAFTSSVFFSTSSHSWMITSKK